MTETIQVNTKVIQAHEVLALLNRYHLTPQFLRGVVIDRAISNISCTESERKAAIETFYQQQQITTPEARDTWLQNQGMTWEQMADMAIRPVLIEKFKTATWGHKVESYFMTHKANLDLVTYSLIRTKDQWLAEELYFRIHEGEQSFANLARQHSQGPEANTGGLLGPVPISQPHPVVAKLLSVSQPGQLWQPLALAEWFLVIRLEKFFPAQLDDSMRRRLIDELFENWLREQLQQVGSLKLLFSSSPA